MYENDCPIKFLKESTWRVLIVVSRKGFKCYSASLWTEVIKICVVLFWLQYVIKVRFFFFFQLVPYLSQIKNFIELILQVKLVPLENTSQECKLNITLNRNHSLGRTSQNVYWMEWKIDDQLSWETGPSRVLYKCLLYL